MIQMNRKINSPQYFHMKSIYERNLMFDFMYFQLPGLLSLSSTFVPTIMNLLKKLAEEGQQRPATADPQNNPALASKGFQNSSSNDLTSTASSGVTSTETGAGHSSRSKEE